MGGGSGAGAALRPSGEGLVLRAECFVQGAAGQFKEVSGSLRAKCMSQLHRARILSKCGEHNNQCTIADTARMAGMGSSTGAKASRSHSARSWRGAHQPDQGSGHNRRPTDQPHGSEVRQPVQGCRHQLRPTDRLHAKEQEESTEKATHGYATPRSRLGGHNRGGGPPNQHLGAGPSAAATPSATAKV